MRLSTSITMRLSTSLKLAIALWLVAEVLAFALVADLIGYPEAMLLTVITSLFGWTMLKRAGASARMKLRSVFNGGQVVGDGSQRFLDELLAGIGALALLIPGFVTDVVGLVLAVPAARDRISVWLAANGQSPRWRRATGRSRASPTIDLDPTEWRKTDSHPASKV